MKCTCNSQTLDSDDCTCSRSIHRKVFVYGLVVLTILISYILATTFNGRTLPNVQSANEKVIQGTATFAEQMTAAPTRPTHLSTRTD